MPDWMRFVRGAVDSEDLPLSISREKPQDTALIAKLRKALTRRFISHLTTMAKKDPSKYKEEFYREYAFFLKEGICQDFEFQEQLSKLLYFETSKAMAGELSSLEEYVSRCTPEQKEIYYLCAPSRELALESPYLEAFEKAGREVIFVYSAIDDFVMANLEKFGGRALVSAEKSDIDFGSKADDEEEDAGGTGGEDSSRVASAVYDTSHIVEETFTFAGGNEARWFFNAGGKLRMKVTNSATNSTSKDTSLSGVITSVGTFDIGSTTSARSGSGDTATVSASSTGYYDLGTSYTTLLHIEESAGTYANNIEIKYEAKVNSAHGDGNGNNGDVVTVKCSALLNDGIRADYTSGNTSSVNVEAEAAGPTDFAFHTVDPTTAQGLSTVYTSISVANVSNAIVNND